MAEKGNQFIWDLRGGLEIKFMTNYSYSKKLRTHEDRHNHIFHVINQENDLNSTAKCLHILFEENVEVNPDALAVIYKNQSLTYGELNTRANQLANYLISLGIGPDALVGVHIDRSIEMIVGLLGILKAGGAYVPLPPDYPKERLHFVLEDTQCPAILTLKKLLNGLSSSNTNHICMDTIHTKLYPTQKHCLNSGVNAKNLAYVIYTSGSTGNPKGVMITHESVVNLLMSYEGIAPKSDDLRGTLICPFGFDVSVWEIFSNLCFGGTLYILDPQIYSNPRQLTTFISKNKISSAYLPPALLDDVAVQFNEFPHFPLTRILVGVEPIKQKTLQKYRNLSDKLFIINGYGPTETTICATFFKFESMDSPDHKTPIGKAINGNNVYILDNNMQPVQQGVSGEIYIGGLGLAKGYLNRQSLTSEKFIQDPFSGKPDAYLYRTGDFARYLEDGNIEFLGRIDHQVKINGYRVELGEIETMLTHHPSIHRAVVLIREDVPGDKRLVAYITRQQHSDINEKQRHISKWKTLVDATCKQQTTVKDPTFNIVGWNDSYTGKPIPEHDMYEWLEYTVQRILSYQPERVLEIGCGTGMLLFRIAPCCSFYEGMDISKESLDHIKAYAKEKKLNNINLRNQSADNFNGIEPSSFSTVIINSVIQFFPDSEYLELVLKEAITATKPGGIIFIGDIRNLLLEEAFHTSVQFYRAHDSMTILQLNALINKNMRKEQDLVVNPDFFKALQKKYPMISNVQILLKRGRYQNELTKFRYDVILHIENNKQPEANTKWSNLNSEKLMVTDVYEYIEKFNPRILGIKDITNSRLEFEVKLLKILSQCHDNMSVGELRELLDQTSSKKGIDPEDWFATAQNLPYNIFINYSWNNESIDRYNLVFQHNSEMFNSIVCEPILENEKSLEFYTNNPLQGQLSQGIEAELRNFLKEHLPNYMLPQAFIELKAFPLTPNGKIDRNALPAPLTFQRMLTSKPVLPRNEMEKKISSIWLEVLGLDSIGIYDNFFDLGGNSLLLTQIFIIITNTITSYLTMVDMFQYPTIHSLVEFLSQTQKDHQLNNLNKSPARRNHRKNLINLQKQRRINFRNR